MYRLSTTLKLRESEYSFIFSVFLADDISAVDNFREKESYLSNLPAASTFSKILADLFPYKQSGTFHPSEKQKALNVSKLRKFVKVFY